MDRKFDLSVGPSLQRVVAVLAVAVVLGACSRDLSAQATGVAAPASAPAATAAANAAGAPAAADPVVRTLPDFTVLV